MINNRYLVSKKIFKSIRKCRFSRSCTTGNSNYCCFQNLILVNKSEYKYLLEFKKFIIVLLYAIIEHIKPLNITSYELVSKSNRAKSKSSHLGIVKLVRNIKVLRENARNNNSCSISS